MCIRDSLSPQLTLPFVPEWADPVWHLFVVLHPERDRLQQHLTEQGIQTIIHYPIPAHRSGAYANLGIKEGSEPICERISREVLSLPIGPQLSCQDLESIVQSISQMPHL